MLRITTRQDDETMRMNLEGKLVSAWVVEAEKAWRQAHVAGRGLQVDLTGVTSIDSDGWTLLAAMKRAGATFVTQGVGMKQLVEDMLDSESGKKARGCGRVLSVVLVFAMALGAFAGPLQAQNVQGTQPPLRLTLKDAVQMALRQNPQVAIANLNLAERDSAREIARASLLPQVSIGASDFVTRANVEALFGSAVPGFPQHIGPFWTVQAGTQFSVPVFDLALWRHWQASRESVAAGGAQRDSVREQNVQLVVSQYLGGLRAAADLAAAKSRLDLAEALFDLASDLEKNGVGTNLDTLRAHVEFQNERQRFASADAQLKLSHYGLAQLLSLDPQRQIELADAPQFFATPSFDADASLASALVARPEMKAIAAESRAASFEQQAARAESAPRVSFGGGWQLEGLAGSTAIPVYRFGAAVDMPIFTGGRNSARAATAGLELKKLDESARATRDQIAQEVQSAAALLAAARVEVDAANLGVSLAQEAVTQARDRFGAGVANNIEVISAQDQLARANDNQIGALYRFNQSRADLARATGQMEAIYAK
jgi:outer membrane protein TolC